MRTPKCFICRRRDPVDREMNLCATCEDALQWFIYRLLRDHGWVAELVCSWRECRAVFYARRLRRPAYCKRACQQAAYRDRKVGHEQVEPRERVVTPLEAVNGQCALCERYPTAEGKPCCRPCAVRVQRYTRTRASQLNLWIPLTCAYEPCGFEFTAQRWRDPAYCKDACRQAAYRARSKAGVPA